MKKWVVIAAAGATLLLSVAPVFAKNPKSPADYNGLSKGKSSVHHLYLYEKDPSDWSVVEEGAWGKMTYDEDSVVFNGHGLLPGEDYTLIEYPEPQTTWPWPVNIIASGTANKGGNVHLSGEYEVSSGQKYWLVLTDDLVGNNLSGYNPTEYLFEYNLTP